MMGELDTNNDGLVSWGTFSEWYRAPWVLSVCLPSFLCLAPDCPNDLMEWPRYRSNSMESVVKPIIKLSAAERGVEELKAQLQQATRELEAARAAALT